MEMLGYWRVHKILLLQGTCFVACLPQLVFSTPIEPFQDGMTQEPRRLDKNREGCGCAHVPGQCLEINRAGEEVDNPDCFHAVEFGGACKEGFVYSSAPKGCREDPTQGTLCPTCCDDPGNSCQTLIIIACLSVALCCGGGCTAAGLGYYWYMSQQKKQQLQQSQVAAGKLGQGGYGGGYGQAGAQK